MEKLKIAENEKLIRDVKSNAVLNTDMTALEKYKARRNREKEISSAINEMRNLKQEFGEIKDLLLQLVKEKNK